MISSISAVGLSQNVLSAGYSTQQQALQALQNTLASRNLNGARSAFQDLQTVLEDSATATGKTLTSNSQLATDLARLGGALNAGNLSTAQSSFATVLGDLKNTASSAQINEATAASQSVQLISDVLSSLNSANGSSSSVDSTNAVLQGIYGAHGGLDIYA